MTDPLPDRVDAPMAWLAEGRVVSMDALATYYTFPPGHALYAGPGRFLRVAHAQPEEGTVHATRVPVSAEAWPMRDALPMQDPETEC